MSMWRRLNRHDDDFRWTPSWDSNGLRRGFADGCPPGLAKKGNGCMPPGQARQARREPSWLRRIMSRSLAGPYSLWYRDNDNATLSLGRRLYLSRPVGTAALIDAALPLQLNQDYYYYPTGDDPIRIITTTYNVPYQYQVLLSGRW